MSFNKLWEQYKKSWKDYDSKTTPRKACWNFYLYLIKYYKIKQKGEKLK